MTSEDGVTTFMFSLSTGMRMHGRNVIPAAARSWRSTRQPDPGGSGGFTRPLPGPKAPAAQSAGETEEQEGTVDFLGCLLAAALLGIGARLLAEWRMIQEEAMWEPDWETESGSTIHRSTSPTGQGVRLELAPERDEVLTAQEIYRQVNPSVVTVMAELGENSMSEWGPAWSSRRTVMWSPMTMCWQGALPAMFRLTQALCWRPGM